MNLMHENKRISIQGHAVSFFIYDFDGVMTDNKVVVREDGAESVICSRADGLAVSEIRKRGIPQVIISTESNKTVISRAAKLDIPVINNVADKKEAVVSYCRKLNIRLEETLFIGNDINDREAMLVTGFPVCPADAYREIKEIAKLVLPVGGGHGVIRALLNFIQ
jgi:3-deoxy-D-manno-octulosonate 8-phosphate phosphatase (KDO 8-P phosphatase)